MYQFFRIIFPTTTTIFYQTLNMYIALLTRTSEEEKMPKLQVNELFKLIKCAIITPCYRMVNN